MPVLGEAEAARLDWVRAEVEDGSDEHCFEVALDGGWVHIRQTDDPAAIVTTTRSKWDAFVLGVRNNEFDHFVTDVPAPTGTDRPDPAGA
ncbi:DUF397 domain-containing protein [Streptomyces calidiresistens]|uniref:DUF397 domain-containing protein n=2 Tax=Streptomyces calidiresistens TaxID=1485586 RepID=A0A7W3T720_9ACTN|nr:DUF397 domain-containing protein [Streptomyces calidiresistens]